MLLKRKEIWPPLQEASQAFSALPNSTTPALGCTNELTKAAEPNMPRSHRRHNESDGDEGDEEKKSSKRHRKEKSRGKDREAVEPSPPKSRSPEPQQGAGDEALELPGPPPQARPEGSPKAEGRRGSDSEEGQL